MASNSNRRRANLAILCQPRLEREFIAEQVPVAAPAAILEAVQGAKDAAQPPAQPAAQPAAQLAVDGRDAEVFISF